MSPALPLLALTLLAAPPAPAPPGAPSDAEGGKLTVERGEDRLVIRVGDELFAEYRYLQDPQPVIFPLNAPGGIPMTRSYPLAEAEGEAHDHPHHRSLWFAHGDVNGVDFWSLAPGHGSIVHTGRLTEVLPRGKTARIRLDFEWRDPEGTVLLKDRRTTLFGAEDDQRWIDFEVALTAVAEEVTFGDTKEGTFALRSNPELRLEGPVAKGRACNSEGIEGADVWGKRADWVHYQGPVGGEPVGFAIFDHPSNPRHPTWWHARAYGLVAANPFGVHDFEKKAAGTGDLTLEQGETLTLRYRLWIHLGEKSPDEVAKAYAVYQAQVQVPD
jgi:hypothetical protein